MIYTVTLNPALDYVMTLDELRTGAVNRSETECFQPGGKGINVSYVLKELGFESTAIGFAAGFTGQELARRVKASGLNVHFLEASGGETRVNVKVKALEETEINGNGPRISPENIAELRQVIRTLSDGDVLILSGSIPGGLSKDLYACLLQDLQDRNVLTVVDAAGPLLIEALKARPFLIKPNLPELEEAVKHSLSSDSEILQAASELQKSGAKNVLVSMGGAGALLLDEQKKVYRSSCPRGAVVNSTGAGDSMTAGFMAGYLKYHSMEAALALGIAAGSATAFHLGLARREEIEELLDAKYRI